MGQNDDMTIRAPDPGDSDRFNQTPEPEPQDSGFQEVPKYEEAPASPYSEAPKFDSTPPQPIQKHHNPQAYLLTVRWLNHPKRKGTKHSGLFLQLLLL